MNMLFYTAFVAIFAVINGKLIQPPQGPEKRISMVVGQDDSETCEICEFAVKSVVDYLQNGDNVAELVRIFHDICDLYPEGMNRLCKTAVDQEGDNIISMLLDHANETCGYLKLCSSQTVSDVMLSQLRQELKKQNSKDVELNTPLCPVCELVVKELESLVDGKSTKAEIEKIVKKVCDKMPGKVKSECNTLVDKYGDKIIDLLADLVKPSLICTILALC